LRLALFRFYRPVLVPYLDADHAERLNDVMVASAIATAATAGGRAYLWVGEGRPTGADVRAVGHPRVSPVEHYSGRCGVAGQAGPRTPELSVRRADGSATLGGTGDDPAITGEPPEEKASA